MNICLFLRNKFTNLSVSGNMQEIIWIFGVSGSGKNTFLKKIQDGVFSGDDFLRFSLPENCKISEQSLVTGKENRDFAGIKKEIEELVLGGFSPVLKFQAIDVMDGQNIPFETRDKFPDLKHRIIMLVVNYSQKEKRLTQRKEEGRWEHEINEERWRKHQGMVLEWVKNSETQGFDVQYIDSSDGYEVVDEEYVATMTK